jgi:hypothetical protein
MRLEYFCLQASGVFSSAQHFKRWQQLLYLFFLSQNSLRLKNDTQVLVSFGA